MLLYSKVKFVVSFGFIGANCKSFITARLIFV
jgi:hypothetical protein